MLGVCVVSGLVAREANLYKTIYILIVDDIIYYMNICITPQAILSL